MPFDCQHIAGVYQEEIKNHTCKIANLCISPVQAGIISFNTPNSSFILDLLLLSIKLCAVLRAIFLPATDVLLGCFFFPFSSVPLLAEVVGGNSIAGAISSVCLGFICIIFLDLVGGGGNANCAVAPPSFSLPACELACLLLAAGVKLECTGDVGLVGW